MLARAMDLTVNRHFWGSAYVEEGEYHALVLRE
jgi:hypothetical protein